MNRRVLPGPPTRNLMSAISWLLNMAAFLSRTVDRLACQFGSWVAGGAIMDGGVGVGGALGVGEPVGDGGVL